MPTIVVPFRGPGGKRRLAPLPDDARAAVAAAMLGDVLAACVEVAPTLVVAPEGAWREAAASVDAAGVAPAPDPGGGQGVAVAAALARIGGGAALIVNADLPCVTPDDLDVLLGAMPVGGLALTEAADGTTNALALASSDLFAPLYGPGSATRFRALGRDVGTRTVPIPNLVDDVDTLDDLRRLVARLGPKTRQALAAVEWRVGAPA